MVWQNMTCSQSPTVMTTLDSFLMSNEEFAMTNQKNSSPTSSSPSPSSPTSAPTPTPIHDKDSSKKPSPHELSPLSSSSSSSPSCCEVTSTISKEAQIDSSLSSPSSSALSSVFSSSSKLWNNRYLAGRICMVLSLFPLMKATICVMHAPVLMETLGMHETLKHSNYLLTHVPFSATYVFFYDAHQWTSAFWFVSGVWQYIMYYYCRDLVAHKYLGYMYVIAAVVSPICGVVMLLYRPKLIGGNNFTVYLLLFTTWYCMNGVYKMLVAIIVNKNLREHQRWALRNIFGPISSISNATTITTLAYMGMPINVHTTRMVMCCLSPALWFLIEGICAWMHPNHEFMTDWAYMVRPIKARFMQYVYGHGNGYGKQKLQ